MELIYDHNLVKQLLVQSKGPERSCKEYANDAGISEVTLSRILTGKRKATIHHLQQLTCDRAKPQCGVTLEQLATAAGYVNINNSDTHNGYNINAMKKSEELEMKVIGALQFNCLQKEVSVEVKKVSAKFYSPDLVVCMAGRSWWLEIVDVDDNLGKYRDIARNIFSRIITIKPDEERYLAVIVNSANMFKELAVYADELAYKGNLLAVYLNESEMLFEKEVVLSTYNDNKDFSLVGTTDGFTV